MPKKISDLVAATQLGDNDSFPFSSSSLGADRRITAKDLRADVNTYIKTQRESIFVSKYDATADYDDLPAAASALPVGGGVIILDNIRLGDTGYTGTTISKDNVSIIGTNKPLLDFVNDAIANNCAVIDGTLKVEGDNVVFGKICVNTNSLALEGDCFQLPSTGGTKGASIIDCAGIGYARDNIYHGLLIENQEGATVLNWQSINNIWGIACKASNCYINGIRTKNHDNGPLIVKSNGSQTVENVIVDGVHYTATVGGNGSLQVENNSVDSTLRNIYISNFVLDGGFVFIQGNRSQDEVSMSNVNLQNGLIDLRKNSTTQNIWLYNNGFKCDADITFTNVKGYGAGTNGVTDTGNKFSDLQLINCEFDKPVSAINQNASTSFGVRLKKSVTHNVSTEIFKYSYTSLDFSGIEVNIGLQSTAGFGAASFSINTAWSVKSINKTNQADFDGMNIELTAAVDTTNRTVTVSAVATNSSSQNVTLYISILPRIAFADMEIIPL